MTRHPPKMRRHCIRCDAYVWTFRNMMYSTPEAAAHARAVYMETRRNWRHMRATVARATHAPHCACPRCDPLFQMTREGDAA